jgi:hypothetical protein
LGNRQTKFDKAHFQSDLWLDHVGPTLEVEETRFDGSVNLRAISANAALRLERCVFSNALVIDAVKDHEYGYLNLEGSVFHHVPLFNVSRLPQATSFHGAKFVGKATEAESAPSHRYLRVKFSENHDREQEGEFYAWEKRCHRKSLPRKTKWFARGVSAFYDWTSAYGKSYERAFAFFFLIQVVFGLGYSIASGRFQIPGAIDATAIAFTLAQVARPFELLGGRAPSTEIYTELLPAESLGWWPVVTAIHGILSLAALALALLALRWRFKRE